MNQSTEEQRQRGQQVASEILRQLGGKGKLSAMVDAENFAALSDPPGLQFSFWQPDGDKPNMVQIELTPMDDYTLTFYRFDDRPEKLESVDRVYGDMLVETLERKTGLAFRL